MGIKELLSNFKKTRENCFDPWEYIRDLPNRPPIVLSESQSRFVREQLGPPPYERVKSRVSQK